MRAHLSLLLNMSSDFEVCTGRVVLVDSEPRWWCMGSVGPKRPAQQWGQYPPIKPAGARCLIEMFIHELIEGPWYLRAKSCDCSCKDFPPSFFTRSESRCMTSQTQLQYRIPTMPSPINRHITARTEHGFATWRGCDVRYLLKAALINYQQCNAQEAGDVFARIRVCAELSAAGFVSRRYC